MYILELKVDLEETEIENLDELVENLDCEMELVDEDDEVYQFSSVSFAGLQELGEQIIQDDPTTLIEWVTNL